MQTKQRDVKAMTRSLPSLCAVNPDQQVCDHLNSVYRRDIHSSGARQCCLLAFMSAHLVYRCSLRGGSFEAKSSNTKKLRIFCKYERNNLVLSIHCQCGVVISITNCYIRFTLLYTVHALRKLNALQLKPRLWLQRAFVITGECLSFSPFYQPRLWRGNNSCGTRPGPSRGTCSGWKGPMPWLCPGSRKILGNNGGARRQDVNAAR